MFVYFMKEIHIFLYFFLFLKLYIICCDIWLTFLYFLSIFPKFSRLYIYWFEKTEKNVLYFLYQIKKIMLHGVKGKYFVNIFHELKLKQTIFNQIICTKGGFRPAEGFLPTIFFLLYVGVNFLSYLKYILYKFHCNNKYINKFIKL